MPSFAPAPSHRRQLSRREVLRVAALAGGGLLGSSLLAACGSNSPSTDATAGTLARIKKTGYVRLSSYQQPPHGWFDISSGTWKGVDVELIQYILPKIGAKHWDYTVADWNAMIPGLEAGRWDMMSIGMSYTTVRAQQVLFSAPAYQYGEAMMVYKGNPHHVQGKGQWSGLKVGGILGSVDDQVVKSVKGAKYVPYQKYSDMYTDLANKRIDVGLVDELEVGYDFKLQPQPNIEVLHTWQGKTSYMTGVVMRKSDAALKAAVDPIIISMVKSGKMLSILTKYGLGKANLPPCENPTKSNAAGALTC